MNRCSLRSLLASAAALAVLALQACSSQQSAPPMPPMPPAPPGQPGGSPGASPPSPSQSPPSSPGSTGGQPSPSGQAGSPSSGMPAPAGGTPPPGGAPAGQPGGTPEVGGSPPGGGPGGNETAAERQERLNREFGKSLGVFDRKMMRDAAILDPDSEEAAGDETDEAGGTEEGDTRVASTSPPATGSGTGRSPSIPSAGRQTPPPPGGSGKPEEIIDGTADDVIARQLREAAENETDPELKEKLWEEYRQYKESVGQ